MRCRDCHDELAHCHEVLIVHADGTAECTGENPCLASIEAHRWRLPCAELGTDTCCSEELPLAA
jgi:hypothetical protein